MGVIKGQLEYEKWKRREFLTRKQAMLAMCFQCNGELESRVDCRGENCPLYQYHPHKPQNWVRDNLKNIPKPRKKPNLRNQIVKKQENE